MLFLFSIFAYLPPQQALDELVLGEWNIQATTFPIDDPSHESVEYYSTIVNETSELRNFDGEIFLTNKTTKLELLKTIQFAFDQSNNTKLSVFLDHDLMANLTIITTTNGLKMSTGNLSNSYSYSLTLLSYKAAELTIYNHHNKSVTLYRMQRTVDEHRPGSGRSFSSVFTLILIMAYIAFGTKNDETPRQNTQEEGDNENENNDGDDKDKEHEKKE